MVSGFGMATSINKDALKTILSHGVSVQCHVDIQGWGVTHGVSCGEWDGLEGPTYQEVHIDFLDISFGTCQHVLDHCRSG